MGFNFNQTVLIGRLTKDPEKKQINDMTISSFSIAVDRFYKKDDTTQKVTDFINIKAFGKLAEISSQYLTKGKAVLIVGRIQVRNYEKNNERKWFTEIIADNIQFLSPPEKQAAEDHIILDNHEEILDPTLA